MISKELMRSYHQVLSRIDGSPRGQRTKLYIIRLLPAFGPKQSCNVAAPFVEPWRDFVRSLAPQDETGMDVLRNLNNAKLSYQSLTGLHLIQCPLALATGHKSKGFSSPLFTFLSTILTCNVYNPHAIPQARVS